MKPFITKGDMTSHGGIVIEADNSFIVEGKDVHLEGMKHFCPKCKVVATAISLGKGFVVVGSKTIIMADDLTSCGAKFIAQQNLAVRDAGSGSGGSSAGSLALQSSFIDKVVSGNFGIQHQLFDETTQEPIIEMPYRLIRASGEVVEGVTDADGKTQAIDSGNSEEKVELIFPDLSKPMESWE